MLGVDELRRDSFAPCRAFDPLLAGRTRNLDRARMPDRTGRWRSAAPGGAPMIEPLTLFDAVGPPPDPGKGAAPRCNGAGACIPGRSREHPTRAPERPPAHHRAPAGTSEVSARRIAPLVRQQRADVLAAIVRAGARGATDAEIETSTGLRAQSVSPRRGELRTLGLIVDSGERRATPRGRPAAVWRARNAEGGGR